MNPNEAFVEVRDFKTLSGTIRRVELRGAETAREAAGARRPDEYWEEDFPELR